MWLKRKLNTICDNHPKICSFLENFVLRKEYEYTAVYANREHKDNCLWFLFRKFDKKYLEDVMTKSMGMRVTITNYKFKRICRNKMKTKEGRTVLEVRFDESRSKVIGCKAKEHDGSETIIDLNTKPKPKRKKRLPKRKMPKKK